MNAVSPFEWLCDELEARTSLKRIEARGTVRLTLKKAGFSPKSVSARELRVVVRKLLAPELAARRIDNAKALCDEIAHDMPMSVHPLAMNRGESATSIFGRLGRMSRG